MARASAEPAAAAKRGRQWWLYPAVVLGLAVIWLLAGFYTVAPNERGVVLRFGRLHAQVGPGIHHVWAWPVGRVYKPRAQEVKRIEVGFAERGEKSSLMRRSDFLTGDENILKVMMVVQYRIGDPVKYLFRVEEPGWLVERTVQAAMEELIAQLPVDDVLTTAKSEIQVRAMELAQERLNAYEAGVVLVGGNLQVVVPPVPVQEAFKDVASAKKDAERMNDEAREYANRVMQQAEGQANQIVSAAEGRYADRVNGARGEANRFASVLAEYRQAREVTRRRLYVDAIAKLFAQVNVVVVDDSRPEITIVEPQAATQ